MDIFLQIGTIASIVGAVISIWQAFRSTKAADEAIRIRDQLLGNRKAAKLGELKGYCRIAQDAMSKYGLASNKVSVSRNKGASRTKDASSVQEFISKLKENSNHLDDHQSAELSDISGKLEEILNQFSQENDGDLLRNHGINILNHLDSLASIITSCLDRRDSSVS